MHWTFQKAASLTCIHRCHRSSRAHIAGAGRAPPFLAPASVPVFITTSFRGTATVFQLSPTFGFSSSRVANPTVFEGAALANRLYL
eukprot:6198648-Pleurochrysis_carterae.AAC.1